MVDTISTDSAAGLDSIEGELSACTHCHHSFFVSAERISEGLVPLCPRCKEKLHYDSAAGQESNWFAFVYTLAAILLLRPAFVWPMFIVDMPNDPQEAGFLRVLKILFDSGEWLLASFVMLASGVFPVLKLVVLLFLTSHIVLNLRRARWLKKIAHYTGAIGFLDVKLTALTFFVFLMHGQVEISSAPGLLAFAVMVLFNVLASRSLKTIEFRLDH